MSNEKPAASEAEVPVHPIDNLENTYEGHQGVSQSGSGEYDPAAAERAAYRERNPEETQQAATAAEAPAAPAPEKASDKEAVKAPEAGSPEMQAALADRDGRFVKDGQIDVAAVEAEYTENSGKGVNDLSPETYEWFAKRGISKSLVQEVVASRQQAGAALAADYANILGGSEQMPDVLQWGRDNWPAEDREAYNRIMQGGDVGAIKLAMRNLKAAYDAADKGVPTRVVKGESGVSVHSGYRDEAAWQADKFSDRYKRDAAYRREVDGRLLRSAWFKR